MLEDKIKATDWEATDEQLAELAARESYLQWLNDNQKTSNVRTLFVSYFDEQNMKHIEILPHDLFSWNIFIFMVSKNF